MEDVADFKSYGGAWHHLPDIILTEIFSYLTLSERANACAVCRRWCRGFASPSLWRSVIIEFKGSSSKEAVFADDNSSLYLHNSNALQFCNKFGKYLHNLHLIFDPMEVDNSVAIQKQIEKFLHRLSESGCNLRKIQLEGVFDDYMWHSDAYEDAICSFAEFFESQHRLQFVHLDFCLPERDIRLLESLVTGSGKTIRTLIFIEFDPHTSIQKAYYNTLSQMLQLQYVKLSLKALDTEVVRTLCEKCINFKTIDIYTLSPEELNMPMVPAEEWETACKLRPKLKVKYEGVLPDLLSKIPWVMPTLMPLVSLKINVTEETVNQNDWTLQRVIEYFIYAFAKSLDTFWFRDFYRIGWEENLNEIMKTLVISCPNLKYLLINTKISISTIKEICQMQLEQKIDIEKFEVYYYSEDEEDEIKLEKVCEKYKHTLGKSEWEFIFVRINRE